MVRRKKRLVKPGLQECNKSGSSSPELGYQGEISSETNDVVNSNCRVTPKKRGPRITVTNDENILMYLEDKITDAFEIAFNSECETEGSRYASEILLAAYNKVEEQSIDSKAEIKTIFFEKFRYRLSFMVESLVSLDNRCRVLLFIAKFSINLWREGANDFINFLTDFCETLSHCDDPAVRQNVCTLVGFLLKEFGNRDSIGCGTDSISIDLRRKLYAVLVERQLDKVVAVRAEVVRSVADIQDDEIPNDFVEAIERSPKDVILMGFRDVAAECRLTAVLGLHVVVIAHCDYLIELASSDPVVKVRVAAIRQLASLPLTFLTEEQRMSLLRAVIFDEDPSIRDVVRNVLLSEWLSFVQRLQEKRNKRKSGVRRMSNGQLRTMKPDVEEINGDEQPHMFNGLRDIKYGHGMGSAAQGLLSMLDFCDDSEAEDLCRTVFFSLFDVVRKILHLDKKSLTHFVSSLVNDKTFPEVLSVHNYEVLLDRSLSKTDQAQFAFFWRVLIEYCCKRAQSEVECMECINMLAPPIDSLCNLVQRLRTSALPPADSEGEEMEAPVCDIQQVAVMHLLGILRRLGRKDLLGMNEWKSLLLSLLRDDSLSKEITDCLMVDLVDVFFQGKPEQFLATVYDVTIEVIRYAQFSEDCNENNESAPTTMIVSCFSFKGTQVHIWALEASGIVALIAEEVAGTVLFEALDAFKSSDESIKISSMDVVTDLILVYGFKEIRNWQHSDDQRDPESIRGFISSLAKIVKSKVSIVFNQLGDASTLLCTKACQCLSKIVLVESIADDVTLFADAVACLISRLFHTSIRRLPEAKSCMEKFFAIFPSTRRRNQLIMVAAFHELMSAIRKASDDDFVLCIDIMGALHLLINTTHPSFLHQAPDMELGSVQAEFMRELLEYLLNHSDDTCASLYWETASLLDLESFSSADLSEVKEIAQKILEEVIACTGLKSAMANEAHKLIRTVDCALHEIETREAEASALILLLFPSPYLTTSLLQDAEREDCLTELSHRDKTARSSRCGRRQTPVSTRTTTPISSSLSTSLKRKKVTSRVKRSTQQLLNSERSPSPQPVLYTIVTPTARSRPQLSRTAKRIAVGKTRRWLFENDH
ncbi:unnamed protein product [Angiostrongylus costaricensis]|uniref:Cnd3 domain-containing protein n=1 Tax=Angiostrongylus costaricensis TaxID=334426 RepID=A0A158PKW0_ANGCS|nr:unnamed protein product [Angiostrongylus costaricensis]